jgi:hypothetical protein
MILMILPSLVGWGSSLLCKITVHPSWTLVLIEGLNVSIPIYFYLCNGSRPSQPAFKSLAVVDMSLARLCWSRLDDRTAPKTEVVNSQMSEFEWSQMKLRKIKHALAFLPLGGHVGCNGLDLPAFNNHTSKLNTLSISETTSLQIYES